MRRLAILSAMLILSLASVLRGQSPNASLTGSITDPDKAVIPGAKVTAIRTDTNLHYESTTNDLGYYYVTDLPPGTYRVEVEKAGFKTVIRTGVVLNVQDVLEVNFEMALGSTSESVTVVAAAPILHTQDATTGQVVARSFLNELPLVGRNPLNLTYLAPGVTASAGATYGSGGGINFVSNGDRNMTAGVLIDGAMATSPAANSGVGNLMIQPTLDAVQEYKVQQNNFSAEVGFSSATNISIITRSGTNSFHGSGFEFVRNSALTATNFFTNAAGQKKTARHLNDFGGTFGGPIVRNKTFFFTSFEGVLDRSASSFTSGVPSALERNGDFGEICTLSGGTFDASGACSNANGQLWDPYTGTYNAADGGPIRSAIVPFNNLATYTSPGNPNLAGTPFQPAAVAGNLIDPVASKMMAYFPKPNLNVGTPAYNRFANEYGTGVNSSNGYHWDLKIDQRFTQNDNLSARFSYVWGPSKLANCYDNIMDPCSNGPNTSSTPQAALNYTHTFSPSTLLTIDQSYTLWRINSPGVASQYPNFNPVTDLGLPDYITRSGKIASPGIDIYGGYEWAAGQNTFGSKTWSMYKMGWGTYQLLPVLTHIRGRHELKFGGEFLEHRVSFRQDGTPAGMFDFTGTSTSQYPYWGGGDAMADFLTGVGGPGTWGQYEITTATAPQDLNYAGFFQDNWRVSDKLTLNLGLRYEIQTPTTERHNRLGWFDPEAPSPLQVAGMPALLGGIRFADSGTRSPYNTDYGNWEPRVGLAYRLANRMVMRAGYGIYDSVFIGSAAGVTGGGYTGYDWTTPWTTFYESDGATPGNRLSNPWPVTGPQYPPGKSLGLLTAVGLGISGEPIRNWNSVPNVQTWSFGFQYELPHQILLDANYVGTKGTHLYFGGAEGADYLNSSVEHLSSSELGALLTYVPNPFYGAITNPASGLSYSYVQAYQLQLPFPQFTGVSVEGAPFANSIYNAFQLRIEKRMSKGLQFLATYTNGKSIDDSSVVNGNTTWLGGSTSLQDPNNRKLERSLSQYDVSQILQFSYVYQLPWGRGQHWGSKWNKWLNGVVGGWETTGIWRFNTGQPLALGLVTSASLPTYGGQRPNLLAPLTRNTSGNELLQYFANPGVAVQPAPYTLGTAPRTLPSIRSPGVNNASLALFKDVPMGAIREGMRFQIRAESFNAFNHPQFCPPNTGVGGGAFGLISCQSNSPREIQLGLKLLW